MRNYLILLLLVLTAGCVCTVGCVFLQPAGPAATIAASAGNETDIGIPSHFEYSWRYNGLIWTHSENVPSELYQYYQSRDHSNREYVDYALSDYDREYLRNLVASFEEVGEKKGYSDNDNVLNVVTFVQSLPYTSDIVSTGADEYPRYPVETLVDGGGDCEDSAILTAALLHEMGYGVVLLKYSNHMAVGVKGDDTLSGSYIPYEGSNYYYIETTANGWGVGEIPEEYRFLTAEVIPLIQSPKMSLGFYAEADSADFSHVYYTINCTITNNGPGTAKNLRIYASAEAPREGEGLVWDQSTISVEDYPEDSTGRAIIYLKVPMDETTRFVITLSGENVESVSASTEVFTT